MIFYLPYTYLYFYHASTKKFGTTERYLYYQIILYIPHYYIITSNGNLKYFFSSLMPSSDGARKEEKKDFTILLYVFVKIWLRKCLFDARLLIISSLFQICSNPKKTLWRPPQYSRASLGKVRQLYFYFQKLQPAWPLTLCWHTAPHFEKWQK